MLNRTWTIPLITLLLAPVASCDGGGHAGADASARRAPLPELRTGTARGLDREIAPSDKVVDPEVASGAAQGSIAGFAQALPDFTLDDPNGKPVTREALAKDGLVLVVTAPILANQAAQEGWAKALVEARGASKASFAFLQDMQPSSFKGTALSHMRSRYAPERGPILLIDEEGALRRELKVAEERTVVLAYDAGGRLVYAEEGQASSDRATKAWKLASGE